MSKVSYVLPVVLGQPGRELFLIKGDLPRDARMALVRNVSVRSLTSKDEQALIKLKTYNPREALPERVRELELINASTVGNVTDHEATLVHGYITNVLPGAFKVPELTGWYLFERPGEVTPLKLARFSINLLDRLQRMALVDDLIKSCRIRTEAYRYASLR